MWGRGNRGGETEEDGQTGSYRHPQEVHGSLLCITHRTALSFKGKLVLMVEIKGIVLNGIYRQPVLT